MIWTVIASHEPEVISSVFLMLLFKDWRKKVEKMNAGVSASNQVQTLHRKGISDSGLAILIGAAEFAERGLDLFSVKDQFMEERDDDDFCPKPHFEKFMSFGCWKDFRRFFPEIFADETRKETDVWYQFSAAIDEFNEIRSNLTHGS
jgi:hypothetical protein